MQTIKTRIVCPALILAALYYCCAHAGEEVATKAATTTVETVLGKTVEGLAVAGPYINVTIQAYRIGQEIRKHTYPTPEEKAHAEIVAERFALLTAKNELRRCFVDNRNMPRNNCGRPTACEDSAKLLSMLGGKDEVNRMTSIFNQHRL